MGESLLPHVRLVPFEQKEEDNCNVMIVEKYETRGKGNDREEGRNGEEGEKPESTPETKSSPNILESQVATTFNANPYFWK